MKTLIIIGLILGAILAAFLILAFWPVSEAEKKEAERRWLLGDPEKDHDFDEENQP